MREKTFIVEGLIVRRVGVPTADYQLEADPELVAPPGRHLKEVPLAVRRSLRHGGGLPPAPKGSFTVQTWDDVDMYLERARWLESYYAERASWDSYAAVCLTMIRKCILQRGYPPGYHVYPEGFVNPGTEKFRGADRMADWLTAHANVETPAQLLRWKRGTNHGLPDSASSDDSLLTHILEGLRVSTLADAERRWAWMQKLFGFSWDTALPPGVQGSRTGHKTKPQAIHRVTERGTYRVGTATSLWPDRRMINMVSAWINSTPLRLLASSVKEAFRRHPAFGHTTARRVHAYIWDMQRRINGLMVADDISGFDKSVSYLHQLQAAEVVYRRIMRHYNVDPALYLASCEIGIVTPPLQLPNAAFLYDRRGTTLSGIIPTTGDGITFNSMRVFDCVAAGLGWTIDQAWDRWEHDWAFVVWGDDTLLIVPKHFNMEAYRARSKALGYEAKSEPAPVFLMRYHGDPRKVHNLGARVFMQSVFRERPTKDPVIEAVGLASRFQQLEGAPDYRLIEQLVFEGNPYYEALGWHTVADAARYAREKLRYATVNQTTELQRLVMDLARGEDDWRRAPELVQLVEALGIADRMPTQGPLTLKDVPATSQYGLDARWARLATAHKEAFTVEDADPLTQEEEDA